MKFVDFTILSSQVANADAVDGCEDDDGDGVGEDEGSAISGQWQLLTASEYYILAKRQHTTLSCFK